MTTFFPDNVAAIGETLRQAGVSAVARNRILSDIKAAVANAGGDGFKAPLSDHLTAAQQREAGYNMTMALGMARRLGVQLSPGKPISALAFSAQARGRGAPDQIMAAKSAAYSCGLMVDD